MTHPTTLLTLGPKQVAQHPGNVRDPGCDIDALAAAQVGADLPCVVRPDLAAARNATVTMAVTGLARDGMTVAEEVHAVQAMLDLGLSQAAVSRHTGRKPAQVRAAEKAAGLDGAAAAAAGYDLTLDELAALAKWQGDEAATATLLTAAKNGTMDHAVARLRRDQAETAGRAALIEQLTAAGVALSEERQECTTCPPGSTH